MKCKVPESQESGMGRPRTSLLTPVHSSTRSAKITNRNEENTVRRSSRRATIERRVWAVPKKSNKYILPSAKKKEIKENKKDRKSNPNRAKNPQGTKRTASPGDDLGPSRKKVKKKNPEEKLGTSTSNIFSSLLSKSLEIQSKNCDVSSSEIALRGGSVGNDSKNRMIYNKVKRKCVNDKERKYSGNIIIQEHHEDNDSSGNCSINKVDRNCDIGKEEKMSIEEDVCLQSAVVVEVVSDFNRSEIDQTFSSCNTVKDSDCDKIVNHRVPSCNLVTTDWRTESKHLSTNVMIKESALAPLEEVDSLESLKLMFSKSSSHFENEGPTSDVTKMQNLSKSKCKAPDTPQNEISGNRICHNSQSKSVVDRLDLHTCMPDHNTSCPISSKTAVNSEMTSCVECNLEMTEDANIENEGKMNNVGTDVEEKNLINESDSLQAADISVSEIKCSSKENDIIDDVDIKIKAPKDESDCTLQSSYDNSDMSAKDTMTNGSKLDKHLEKESIRAVEDFKLSQRFDCQENTSEISLDFCESQHIERPAVTEMAEDIFDEGVHELNSHEKVEKIREGNERSDKVTVSSGENCMEDDDQCDMKNHCIPVSESDIKIFHSIKENLCALNNKSRDVSLHLNSDGSGDNGEDHVSLSVALAQLVDSECSYGNDGSETLTIHSAAAVSQVHAEKNGIFTFRCNSETHVKKDDPRNEDYLEEEEGKLLIKEDDDDISDSRLFSGEDKREEVVRDELIDKQEEQNENEKTIEETTVDVEENCNKGTGDLPLEEKSVEEEDIQPLNLHKPKKQIPPLIKINSRPPAIKTPLKCPECPMQFCTVRSLFWHFGLHGARSRDTCVPPILLQDLIVPWDKPSLSLFLSKAQEILDKSERTSVYEDTLSQPLVPASYPLLITSSAPSILSSSLSVSTASSLGDCTARVDNADTDRLAPLPLLRKDNCIASNGDVILKIPIPRLKHKLQASSSAKTDRFISILPKMPTQKTGINRSAQVSPQPNVKMGISSASSPSPLPQVTLPPSSLVDTVKVTPQTPPFPSITVRSKSSKHQVHIQPITTSGSLATQQALISSQPLVSTQSLSSQPVFSSSSALGLSGMPILTTSKAASATANHITIIPVENAPSVNSPLLSKVSQPSVRMEASSQAPSNSIANPGDSMVEKDGLVMINSNLALRIVSSIPTTLDSATNTTSSTSIYPISNPSVNNITILPQMEGSRTTSLRETSKMPDILTIVPQVDLSKRLSPINSNSSSSNSLATSGSSTTPSSSSSAPASQVVKLYLLQPKDTSNQSSKLTKIPETIKNFNGIEFRDIEALSDKMLGEGRDENSEKEYGDDDENDEDEEKKMVIADFKEDIEDEIMDPLSLCAVTMEDELLEGGSNITSSTNFLSNSSNSASTESDKEAGAKHDAKIRGKKEKLDMVKYEARRYVCCFCNRRFGWSTDLKRHVILHTGERPFQCKVCPASFTRKFLLQNHMRRMHPDKCRMSDLWP